MWPTLLFRLFVVSGSLKLHVQSKTVICGPHQYTVTNGNSSYCLNCATCHPGYGLYPVCGQSLTDPPSNIGCKRCPNETFSDEYDSAPCQGCQQCAKLEIVTAPCTRNSNRICNGTCTKGYFFAKKALHTCQQCSYCCFDGKDEEQPECIEQGLNASSRHCSARLDKQCGPSSTATVTTQGKSLTHLPTTTHSPSLTKLTISTPRPTNHHVGNPAILVPSILSGLFFAVLVVAAMFYMYKRKKQMCQRRTAQDNGSNAGEEGSNHAQGSYDNNTTQVTPVVEYHANPRLQALQNTGYASTPEVSPSATPQHTDDEMGELPDVVAVQKKRRLKRQSSKETQSSVLKEDGDDERLLDLNDQGANKLSSYKGQDSKGVGQPRSRSRSLDVLKRKFSFSLEKDDYQPLGGEDPDELQGNGMFEPKPRSGSVLSFKATKRKLSGPEKQKDYSLVTREDPDADQCKAQLTSYTEPIKIEVEPIHQRQKEGSRVEFKCNVHGKNTKVFYQWVKDGTEMQGQNNSSLVLGCVELRDFGCYVCHVSDANGDCIKSSAVLDVAPRVGMDYKCLRQVDDNTQSKVETLLTKNVRGTGGWKQVAIKYGMDEVNRGSLDGSPDAGKITVGYVKATNPDLTVYEFCKTLKEPNIRRFDVVKELLGHLSVPSSEKTT